NMPDMTTSSRSSKLRSGLSPHHSLTTEPRKANQPINQRHTHTHTHTHTHSHTHTRFSVSVWISRAEAGSTDCTDNTSRRSQSRHMPRLSQVSLYLSLSIS